MKRRRVILVLVGCFLVAAALLAPSEQREPEYNGRSLTLWLTIYLCPTYGEAQHEAADAVRQIGTNAIPYLLKWMHEESHPWRRKAAGAVTKLPAWLQRPHRIVKWLFGYSQSMDSEASWAGFKILGAQAGPAIPELTRRLNDPKAPEIAWQAAHALACLGKDALPSLLAAVGDQRAPNRTSAATWTGTMGYLGTNANPAVTVLIQCLKDTDCSVSNAVASSLEELALAMRADPDGRVRAIATNALLKIAPEVLEPPGAQREGSLKQEN